MNRSALAPAFFAILFACGTESAPPAASSDALAPFHVAAAPAGAKSVLEVRASAKSGDDVVVRGRAQDFVNGFAAIVLIDSSLKACSDEGDAMKGMCETPWDFCCVPPEERAAASATVEFRDANGLLKSSAQGFHGLDHLDTLVVSGKVERDASGSVVIVAKNFSFEKNPTPAK
jgi:hypothetical protein